MRSAVAFSISDHAVTCKRLCCAVAACLALLASGCAKVQLYSDLEEHEANDMMALLLTDKIECTKSAGAEGKWMLSVSQAEFAKAVKALQASGYPKEHFAGLGESFKKSGLISSPTEERIRFMHALAQDLAATISRIDGVVVARVHIVLPDNNPFAEKVKPSSAAVFIKHRTDANLDLKLPEIRQLVQSSIEGLDHENVSVVMVAADEMPTVADTPPVWEEVFNIQIAPQSKQRFWLVFGGVVGLAVFNLAIAIVAILRWRSAAGRVRQGAAVV